MSLRTFFASLLGRPTARGRLGPAADVARAHQIVPPAFQQTPADTLHWLCDKYQCTYWRQRTDTGFVKIGLIRKNGESIIVEGRTTPDVVAGLVVRMSKLESQGLL